MRRFSCLSHFVLPILLLLVSKDDEVSMSAKSRPVCRIQGVRETVAPMSAISQPLCKLQGVCETVDKRMG
ncbi:hypothetical protein JTE90_016918 [Oedothorax gibbosus]|uniref:Secreted protein n=1 Tax=Oedothorax gibbosus TaxID=931172 RepID=A0AAV6UV43_9ARAC|nr:hypothetical protein JTE90_016918 [Oedothorax gibbosus]